MQILTAAMLMVLGSVVAARAADGSWCYRDFGARQSANCNFYSARECLIVAGTFGGACERNTPPPQSKKDGAGRRERPLRANTHSPRLPAVAALAAYADDYIDAGDFKAIRCGRRLVPNDFGAGDIEQLVGPFHEEVAMLGGISIEIGFRALNSYLSQEPDFSELMQRIVDGRERHWNFGASGLLVKHFGSEVAVAFAEQDPAKRHALAGRTQSNVT